MLLTPDRFASAFEEIRRTSLTHSTCKLAIFVACLNVDAICAAKIFCMLLKKNLIVYQMIPVVGYNDLKKKFAKLDDSISNVIMIDCGSMVDLESFLDIDVHSYIDQDYYQSQSIPMDENDLKLTRKIYVIDGHRPWNLDNLFGSQIINCFDDGSAKEELKREQGAYNFLVTVGSEEEAELDEESEESGEEDEEDHSSIEGIDVGDSRKRTSSESLDNNDEDSKKKTDMDRKRKKTHVRESEQRVEDYYNQGTTVVTSAAFQLYTLLSTIGESNADYLWLSIIGTTSLNANYNNAYEDLFPLLKEEVNRIQATKDVEPENQSGDDDLDKDMGEKADNKSLQIDKEYSLFLLRHWNLYDAFFYSNYVNSKLQLYTAEGKKKLNTMFARMGISLVSASQNWHYLDLDLKKRINTIFSKNLTSLGLTDVIRDGFVRNYGFDGAISAGDFVEAVTALLEFDGDIKLLSTKHQSKKDSTVDKTHVEELNELIAKREAQFIRNFWKAYDALTSIELIRKGITIAQLQQKFIFEKGFEIIHKRMIKNLRIFRLVVLKDSFTANNTITDITINNYAPSRHSMIIGTSNSASSSSLNEKDTVDFHTLGSSQSLFQNPLILTKLGNWILEACAEMNGSPLPLVIASLDRETSTYLVCGLPPKYPNMKGLDNNQLDQSDKTTTVLNTFSIAFQEIANSTGAKARIDSFESTIIEIRKEDLPLFLERLTLSGLV